MAGVVQARGNVSIGFNARGPAVRVCLGGGESFVQSVLTLWGSIQVPIAYRSLLMGLLIAGIEYSIFLLSWKAMMN